MSDNQTEMVALLEVAEYRRGMDQWFAAVGKDASAYPFETRIILYAANNAMQLFEFIESHFPSGANGTPVPFARAPLSFQVATIVMAVQCVHLLIRLSMPEAISKEDERSAAKRVVVDNLLPTMLDVDINKPGDAALGIMSAAALQYDALRNEDAPLLEAIDMAWRRHLNDPASVTFRELLNHLRTIVLKREKPVGRS